MSRPCTASFFEHLADVIEIPAKLLDNRYPGWTEELEKECADVATRTCGQHYEALFYVLTAALQVSQPPLEWWEENVSLYLDRVEYADVITRLWDALYPAVVSKNFMPSDEINPQFRKLHDEATSANDLKLLCGVLASVAENEFRAQNGDIIRAWGKSFMDLYAEMVATNELVNALNTLGSLFP